MEKESARLGNSWNWLEGLDNYMKKLGLPLGAGGTQTNFELWNVA